VFEIISLIHSSFGLHRSFETGYNSTALVHVTAILDPLTELAQRWSTTLKVLSEMDFVYVKVILLPDLNIEEVSLILIL
jgi:UDP-glucose:glycoprotein glucosyltransferase